MTTDRVESIRSDLRERWAAGLFPRSHVEYLLDENTRALTLIDKLTEVAEAAKLYKRHYDRGGAFGTEGDAREREVVRALIALRAALDALPTPSEAE